MTFTARRVFWLCLMVWPAISSRAAVPLPAINTNNIIVVTNAVYGAVGDGVSTNTTAIQNAINAATAGGKTNGLFGGTVEIPPGIYLCGPVTFKNNVNLQVDAGAILRMLPFGQYPMTWYTNGSNVYFVVAGNFLSANNLTNIEISGSGAIDGQGSPWWPWAYTNNAVRPIMISWVGCNRELIQNVTLSNSPEFHIAISYGANSTVQYVTERAPSSSDPTNPSHNTDACDISGTNTLVQSNNISVGDDNFTCGGNSANIIISNNVYGEGHGTSIGSYTSPSVSNYFIINCTYTNTVTGAHIKTDRGRGGFVHNINYLNLTMTNVEHPIQIYCQYTNKTIPSLDSITPAVAAAFPIAAIDSTTPHYRDILLSNIIANAQSSRVAGLIWGLPESSISNLTLVNVHLIGSKTFGIYDAKNVQIIDSTHSVPGGIAQFSFFDANVTFSNSTPSASVVTLDGATTNGIANTFAFYNSLMSLINTNALDLNSAVTLGASTFIISNNFAMTPSNSFTFVLGTNTATVVVKGNLALGGTNNIVAGPGFTNGTYTLMNCTGNLGGAVPVLGATPAGYTCALVTNSSRQVNLIVTSPPLVPASVIALGTNLLVTLQWQSSAGATGYKLGRSTTNGGPYATLTSSAATNYSDAAVNPGMTYYYVVTATNAAGLSPLSAQASALVLPSASVTNVNYQISGNRLQLAWPSDHTGWRLEAQTNIAGAGLGTNWVTVPASALTNQVLLPVDPKNAGVFFRLAYP